MAEVAELNLNEEKTVRIYADVSREADLKLRFRALQEQQATGVRITRKQYLEKLIADDVAKVQGASLREVSMRRMK